MIVLILEKVSASLRGELSRWLLEPKSGVFVGRVSALVRDKLWQKCVESIGPDSGGLLVHRDDGEQGFVVRTAGDPSRDIVGCEGIQLVRVPYRDGAKGRKRMRLGRDGATPRAEDLPFVRESFISPLQSEGLVASSNDAPGATTMQDTAPQRVGTGQGDETPAMEASEPRDDESEEPDVPLWWTQRNKSEPPRS